MAIKGTANWLKNRKLNSHHHVILNPESSSFARYIRFSTGRAFAVVLNGGGARGFTHIGVLKSLEELKQPIDYIAGCSMGAAIGASYVLGGGTKLLLIYHMRMCAT